MAAKKEPGLDVVGLKLDPAGIRPVKCGTGGGRSKNNLWRAGQDEASPSDVKHHRWARSQYLPDCPGVGHGLGRAVQGVG